MKKHVIAVTTVKGGVAKTTTAGALAEAAALDGRKVLAIDLDPQGALSVWYRATGAKQTAFNAFSGGDLSKAITPTAGDFDLIPGSGNLSGVETDKHGNRILTEALEPIKRKYDFIIIDTPPTMGRLMYNAIFAANEIICPLEADICAVRGLLTTIDIFNQAKRSKRNMKVLGVILAKYDNRPNINRDLKAMIQEEASGDKIPYLGEIRKCVKVQEAQALAVPLYQHAPKCTAAKDYAEIYRKISI